MTDKTTLDSYEDLVLSFTEFLTVAVHAILYERNIYPRTSFLNARKYNYPVRQSRHPQVCKWIQDAIAAVEKEMLQVGRSLVSFIQPSAMSCIFCPKDALPCWSSCTSLDVEKLQNRSVVVKPSRNAGRTDCGETSHCICPCIPASSTRVSSSPEEATTRKATCSCRWAIQRSLTVECSSKSHLY